MAVIVKLSPEMESRVDVDGRPDIGPGRVPDFGVTMATRHPPYVFSTSAHASLVHQILYVEMHWYAVNRGGHGLVRLQKPVLFAHTGCRVCFRVSGHRVRTCLVPNPDALLCKACQGLGRNFRRGKWAGNVDEETGLTRHQAGVRLGCVVEGY